jgi:hypothetical protein
MVKLEVMLPSMDGQRSGVFLRSQGHVVRSEEVGFAAVANMGFRMQLSERRAQEPSFGKGNGGGTYEANSKGTPHNFRFLVSRSYSA